MKDENQIFIMFGLVIVIIILSAFLLIDKLILVHSLSAEQRNVTIAYQRGMQDGYVVAVNQLIQEAKKCQEFPVFLGDKNITLMAVDCEPEETLE